MAKKLTAEELEAKEKELNDKEKALMQTSLNVDDRIKDFNERITKIELGGRSNAGEVKLTPEQIKQKEISDAANLLAGALGRKV